MFCNNDKIAEYQDKLKQMEANPNITKDEIKQCKERLLLEFEKSAIQNIQRMTDIQNQRRHDYWKNTTKNDAVLKLVQKEKRTEISKKELEQVNKMRLQLRDLKLKDNQDKFLLDVEQLAKQVDNILYK